MWPRVTYSHTWRFHNCTVLFIKTLVWSMFLVKAVSRSTMDLNRTQESLNVTLHLKKVALMARDSEKTAKGDTAAKDVRLTEHSVCVCVCVCGDRRTLNPPEAQRSTKNPEIWSCVYRRLCKYSFLSSLLCVTCLSWLSSIDVCLSSA